MESPCPAAGNWRGSRILGALAERRRLKFAADREASPRQKQPRAQPAAARSALGRSFRFLKIPRKLSLWSLPVVTVPVHSAYQHGAVEYPQACRCIFRSPVHTVPGQCHKRVQFPLFSSSAKKSLWQALGAAGKKTSRIFFPHTASISVSTEWNGKNRHRRPEKRPFPRRRIRILD